MGVMRKGVATYNMSGLWDGDSLYISHEIMGQEFLWQFYSQESLFG